MNNAYIKNILPGQYFESILYPGEWYLVTDDKGAGPEDCKFAICIQTGQVRVFYHSQLVERIYLTVTKNDKPNKYR